MGRLHTSTPRGRGVIPLQCRKSYARIATVAGLVYSARCAMEHEGHTLAPTERVDLPNSGPADLVRCVTCHAACYVSFKYLRRAWSVIVPGHREMQPILTSCPPCAGDRKAMRQ